MRAILALALLWSASAYAERKIPTGEQVPHVIERIYDSQVGEIQFTSVGVDGHSGFLRKPSGYLIGFHRVHGPAFCQSWFLSEKTSELPANCEFVFFDEHKGEYHSVRSAEMEEQYVAL